MTASTLWRATRAYSFPVSLIPVLLGTILAARGMYGDGRQAFHPVAFGLVLVGAYLAHAGANILNDYFDFVRGVDTRPEHGSGVLTGGLMTQAQALAFGAALMAGVAACGLFLLPGHAAMILPPAFVGLACAVLYPALLKQFALGELLVVLGYGLALTGGAYGVQVGPLSAHQCALIALYAVPFSLLASALLYSNNLRDAADDRAARVRTVANLLPPRAAQGLQFVLVFSPVPFVLAGVLLGRLPVWSLASLLSLPLLVGAYRTGSVFGLAQTLLVFGLLYDLSFLPTPVYV